jgi:hypothetical protein
VLESGGNIVDNLTGIFSQPEGVAIGDLTNDGQNELAVADAGTNTVTVLKSDKSIVQQWPGLGQPVGVAIGDYDNLGLNEIAITETYPAGNVTVYAENKTVVANWPGRNDPTGVTIGDFNNDGKNQLVFTEVSTLTVEASNATVTVPELPSFAIVPVLMLLVLIAVIIRKKRVESIDRSFATKTQDRQA